MKFGLVNMLFFIYLVEGVPENQYQNFVDDNDATTVTSNQNNKDQPRIVNGALTRISSYPYQLSLQNGGHHFCGAALIAPTWAITAAHCTSNYPTKSLSVRAKATVRNFAGQVVNVVNKIEHPNFSERSLDYDIALLELEKPISEETAKPIGLPKSTDTLIDGSWASVTGWGRIAEDQRLANTLRVIHIPIVNQTECRKLYGKYSITDRMFCAGFVEGGTDSCFGDSGGPLNRNGVLLGVVSWGNGCAREGFPGVYANVITLRDFIKSTAGI